MKKSYPVFTLILFYFFVNVSILHSQSGFKSWTGWNEELRLRRNMKVVLDIQPRSDLKKFSVDQTLFNIGAGYSSGNFAFNGGTSIYRNSFLGKPADARDEFRWWGNAVYRRSLNNWKLDVQFRLEDRFFTGIRSGFFSGTDYYGYLARFRSDAEYSFRREGKKLFSLIASEEYFLGGKYIPAAAFDQNRSALQFEIELHHDFSLLGGYMCLLKAGKTGNVTLDHVILLTVMHSIDLN